MGAKRKIGIGVCGLADLLASLGLPYASDGALQITRDILAWITYTSKLASRQLAQQRGPFPALCMSRYAAAPDFLSTKFGAVEARTVRSEDWERLGALIQRDGLLRNATTTALPPSGRTAVLLDASNSIEPWFSIVRSDGSLQPALSGWVEREHSQSDQRARITAALIEARTCQAEFVPAEVREVYRSATEIHPFAHLRLAAAATQCVDEGASKTINLSADCTPHIVGDVFRRAWELGLKAVSVYRDGTVQGQPERS